MKFTLHRHVTGFGVFALGLVLCAAAGKSLMESGEFGREPNILSLNGSPFGKTIAMAMQGPVDVYWHEGEAHDHVHAPGESCSGCDHDTQPDSRSDSEEIAESGDSVVVSTGGAHGDCEHGDCSHGSHEEHNHGPNEACSGCDQAGAIGSLAAAPVSSLTETLRSGILQQIQDWQAEKNTRHNPLANSEIHKHFIRRQVEKKLMQTYRMDPTNYASYGAYFLFLSESSLSDRESSIENALILSQTTVQYCLREREDAQSLLTGAAAAHDTAQLLVNTGHEKAFEAAVQYSHVAEKFLDDFEQAALQMAFDGSWERYSNNRRAEMTERARLLRKLVEADRKIRGMNVENQTAKGGASAG